MYRLERITLHNWNLLEAKDIEVRGAIGLLGPTGSGKSSIIDAIQTVISGNNMRALELNASAGGPSSRTVRDYCLGVDDQVSEKPLRERCDSVLALAFRDDTTGTPVSFGVLLRADVADTREHTRALFVLRGHSFRISDHIITDRDGDQVVLNNEQILERLRASHKAGLKICPTSRGYIEEYLIAMRRRGATPDPKHFLRNFANAVAFRHIDDPTEFVRKHVLEPDMLEIDRVRDSIRNWRQLEAEVQRLEDMLADVREVRSRLQTWARQHIALNTHRFVAAHAERVRLDLEIARVGRELAAAQEELAKELSSRRRNEAAIEDLAESRSRTNMLIAQSEQGGKLHALSVEERAEAEKRRQAIARLGETTAFYGSVASLDQIRARIPIRLHGAIDAAVSLRKLIAGRPSEACLADTDALAALEARIKAIGEAEQSLIDQRDALSNDIVALARNLEDRRAQVVGATRDGAVLSLSVRRLMDDLAGLGIKAIPLPDVVEVTDPDWAFALESLLGPFREALIVPPHQVEAAHEHMYRRRADYHGCRLVNTRKTRTGRTSLPVGSIAELIATDNEDARVFIERQIGRFVRVPDFHELERYEHAIMPNGKTNSGLGLRVFRDLKPILGKTAQARALEETRAELAAGEAKYAELVKDRRFVDSALALVVRLKTSGEISIEAAAAAARRAETALQTIADQRLTIEDGNTKALRGELAQIEADITARKREIDADIAPRIAALEKRERELQFDQRKYTDARADRATQEVEMREVEAPEEYQRMICLAGEVETVASAEAQIASLAAASEDPRRELAELRNRADQELKRLPTHCEENRKRGSNLFTNFVSNWLTENPLPQDAGEASKFFWAVYEENRLEAHELRPHRERVERARRDVEAALKEDLLTKLAEKFRHAGDQIDRLNRRLVTHTFTGQTYSFSRDVDPRFKALYRLAREVADNPERGFIGVGADGEDQLVQEALKQIDAMLEKDADKSTKELADYRNYFTFELWMINERGVKTSLSRRAGSGSGGQKQAPYYIAIAAAMASAYYPGASGSADGMGLVVFDEGFNKLDVVNTQAVISFFSSLKLQVAVAAPEQKRMDFLEVMDTLISVHRSPSKDQIFIDVETPGPKAREELAKINPVRLGLDHFRTDLPRAAE